MSLAETGNLRRKRRSSKQSSKQKRPQPLKAAFTNDKVKVNVEIEEVGQKLMNSSVKAEKTSPAAGHLIPPTENAPTENAPTENASAASASAAPALVETTGDDLNTDDLMKNGSESLEPPSEPTVADLLLQVESLKAELASSQAKPPLLKVEEQKQVHLQKQADIQKQVEEQKQAKEKELRRLKDMFDEQEKAAKLQAAKQATDRRKLEELILRMEKENSEQKSVVDLTGDAMPFKGLQKTVEETVESEFDYYSDYITLDSLINYNTMSNENTAEYTAYRGRFITRRRDYIHLAKYSCSKVFILAQLVAKFLPPGVKPHVKVQATFKSFEEARIAVSWFKVNVEKELFLKLYFPQTEREEPIPVSAFFKVDGPTKTALDAFIIEKLSSTLKRKGDVARGDTQARKKRRPTPLKMS